MALVGYGGQSQQRWGDSTASAGDIFRDLHLTDLRGVPQSTTMARRKGSLLLAFFTTQDQTSAALLPLLQSLSDAYKESGKLSVIAVSETDDDDAVKAFADANGIKFPVVIDRERYHATTYGFTLFPTLLLVTGAGQIQHKVKGAKVLADLQAVSDKLGKLTGMQESAKLENGAFLPAVAPPPPPPADPAAAPAKP